MGLKNHLHTIEAGLYSCLDVASFSAAGYLSGRVVNAVTKWSSAPDFVNKFGSTDLQGASVCCALFITIDRLFQAILHEVTASPKIDKPLYSAIRISVNAVTSVQLYNLLAPSLKMAQVDVKATGAIIATALVIYSTALFYMGIFNYRH